MVSFEIFIFCTTEVVANPINSAMGMRRKSYNFKKGSLKRNAPGRWLYTKRFMSPSGGCRPFARNIRTMIVAAKIRLIFRYFPLKNSAENARIIGIKNRKRLQDWISISTDVWGRFVLEFQMPLSQNRLRKA